MPVKYLDSKYYQKIKFKAAYVFANDTNVALVISESSITSVIQNSVHAAGLDIVVTDSAGNLIPREIAYIDKVTYKIEMHIKVPVLSTVSGGTDLYIQCGGSLVAVANDPTVWSKYKVVYHLNETSGNIIDSVTNFDGTPSGIVYSATGKIKKGIEINTNTDHVDCGDITSFNSKKYWTIEFWLEPKDISTAMIYWVKTKGGTGDFYLYTNAGLTRLIIETGPGDRGYCDYSTFLVVGSKIKVSIVHDGDGVGNSEVLKLYINDSQKLLSFSGTIDTTMLDYSGVPFYIGYNLAQAGIAIYDEFRISENVFSENQLKTNYNNQNLFDSNGTWTIDPFSAFLNTYFKYW